jgi:carbonic anhydrase
MRTQTQITQESLTPQDALLLLQRGNERFVANLKMNRNLLQQVNETANGQFPFAVILSCIDSRTSAELIFDQGLGDIFSVRLAGNIVNDDVLGCMEFACKVAGAKLVVVLGHSACGAVKGACGQVQLGHLTGLLEKIRPSVEEVASARGGNADRLSEDFLQDVARANVRRCMAQIRERSTVLEELVGAGKVMVVGGMYDVSSGVVELDELE